MYNDLTSFLASAAFMNYDIQSHLMHNGDLKGLVPRSASGSSLHEVGCQFGSARSGPLGGGRLIVMLHKEK